MLVSLDPGKKVAGVAVFEDNELSAAWLVRGIGWLTTADTVYSDVVCRYPPEVYSDLEFVFERMQIYTQNKLKGDPNDLVDVALMSGATAALFSRSFGARVKEYLPRQWSMQPKNVKERRVKERLSKDELARIELPAKSYRHNVYDTIGIGLYHLQRW